MASSNEERVNGTSNIEDSEDSEDEVAGEYLEVKKKMHLLLLEFLNTKWQNDEMLLRIT